MTNVLFVCTGHSCRSQMAEGWLRDLGGDRFGTDSAGTEVHGQNPLALAVMAVFRASRDAIRERIVDLISRLEAGNDEGEEP